jgi:hypothetical protein
MMTWESNKTNKVSHDFDVGISSRDLIAFILYVYMAIRP